jgi:hypothetical protein
MEEVLTAEYHVQSEDGRIFDVLEYATVSTNPIASSSERVKGGVRFILRDGRSLDRRKDGSFQIVDTGEILRQI